MTRRFLQARSLGFEGPIGKARRYQNVQTGDTISYNAFRRLANARSSSAAAKVHLFEQVLARSNDLQLARRESGLSGREFEQYRRTFGNRESASPFVKENGRWTFRGARGFQHTFLNAQGICSIKAKETQFAEGLPSILWIDFRHLGQWPAVLTEKQSSPLISGRHGTLCSGAIWYAFFGWNGAPVFDDKIGGGYTVTPMAHDGRFYKGAIKSSRYSAAIICLQKATILFENPVTKTPLTDEQRATLTRLPWFSLEYSAAEWRPGDLDRAHELARSMISALEKHAGHSNPVWG
jgi:hypothetical protein